MREVDEEGFKNLCSKDNVVEVQPVPKQKKVKKEKQDKDNPTSIFLKEYIGSGAGLGETSFQKLEAVGVTTVYDVLIRGSNEIKNLTDMENDRLHKLIKLCVKVLENNKRTRNPKLKISELKKYRNGLKKIPCGVDGIDKMLSGGLELEALTEVYGKFASGKTQFAYSIVAEAIYRHGWKVSWIDCEDTFDPDRLIQIIKARGYGIPKSDDEIAEYLDEMLTYTHTPNTDLVVEEIHNLSPLLVNDEEIKLIIVDGAIGQFREEYLGRGTLASRQQNLAKFMGILKNTAYFFNVAVLVTNQVYTDPSQMYGDPTMPVGGDVVGHAPTYRLYFKKAGKKRYCTAIDSPKQAVYDEEFILNEKGVDNPTLK